MHDPLLPYSHKSQNVYSIIQVEPIQIISKLESFPPLPENLLLLYHNQHFIKRSISLFRSETFVFTHSFYESLYLAHKFSPKDYAEIISLSLSILLFSIFYAQSNVRITRVLPVIISFSDGILH